MCVRATVATLGGSPIGQSPSGDAYSFEQSVAQHPTYAKRTRFDEDGDLILLAIEHGA